MKRTNKELLEWFGLKVGDRILCHSVEHEVIEDDDGIFLYNGRSYLNLYRFIDEDYTIIKTPKLSDAERVILENLPKDCSGWITRDRDNILIGSEFKPLKYEKGKWHFGDRNFSILPFEHLFQFIARGDEPYEIKELLK